MPAAPEESIVGTFTTVAVKSTMQRLPDSGPLDAPSTTWVPGGRGYLELSARKAAQAARTRTIVEAADLSDRGALGGWFTAPEEAPPLGWILLHVLGEYGTHQGHLDIVAELVADARG